MAQRGQILIPTDDGKQFNLAVEAQAVAFLNAVRTTKSNVFDQFPFPSIRPGAWESLSEEQKIKIVATLEVLCCNVQDIDVINTKFTEQDMHDLADLVKRVATQASSRSKWKKKGKCLTSDIEVVQVFGTFCKSDFFVSQLESDGGIEALLTWSKSSTKEPMLRFRQEMLTSLRNYVGWNMGHHKLKNALQSGLVHLALRFAFTKCQPHNPDDDLACILLMINSDVHTLKKYAAKHPELGELVRETLETARRKNVRDTGEVSLRRTLQNLNDMLANLKANADSKGMGNMRMCRTCGMEERELQKQKGKDKKMLKCARCKMVWYCSPQCQKMDWKAGHKNDCVKLTTSNRKAVMSQQELMSGIIKAKMMEIHVKLLHVAKDSDYRNYVLVLDMVAHGNDDGSKISYMPRMSNALCQIVEYREILRFTESDEERAATPLGEVASNVYQTFFARLDDEGKARKAMVSNLREIKERGIVEGMILCLCSYQMGIEGGGIGTYRVKYDSPVSEGYPMFSKELAEMLCRDILEMPNGRQMRVMWRVDADGLNPVEVGQMTRQKYL